MLGFFQRLAASRDDAAQYAGTGEYADIAPGQVAAYQRYFTEIVNSISVSNLAKKLRGQRHDLKQDQRDQQMLRHICSRAQTESRVQAEHMVRLLELYALADLVLRAKHKHKWVGRVISGRIGVLGLEASGLEASGPDASGPDALGPDALGPQTPGPGPARS